MEGFILAILANLTSSLIEGTGNFLSGDLSSNLKWIKWKKENNLTQEQNDFLAVYAQTLIRLKKENKPDALLKFYIQEGVVNVVRDILYTPANNLILRVKFKELTEWFTLDNQLTHFSSEEELDFFLKSLKAVVNSNRDLNELEVIKKINNVEKLLEKLIEGQKKKDLSKEQIEVSQADKKTKRKDATPPPDSLIERLLEKRVIPLIGAGVSISALSESEISYKMPSYGELLELLIIEVEKSITRDDHKKIKNIERVRDFIETGDVDYATNFLVDKVMDKYIFFRGIRKILNPLDKELIPSPAHNLLRTLDFELIITTNYDRLLEKFVGTSHEVITPIDEEAFKLLRENFRNSYSKDKYILKLHGDLTRPETIAFGVDKLKELYKPSVNNNFHAFLQDIFQHNIILFLGCSFDPNVNEGQVELLRNILKNLHSGSPFQQHFALVEKRDPSVEMWRDNIAKETGIEFIRYEPDSQHSQVWEFISYLFKGKVDEPKTGKKWAQWYRKQDRGGYLSRQLFFEKNATSIRFLTTGLTNSIATEDHLNVVAARELQDADYDEEDVKTNIIPNMFARFENLEKRLKEDDLEVRAMFLKSKLDAEFDNLNDIIIGRYQHLLELLDNSSYDVEVRLIEGIFEDYLKEREASYAIIFSSEPKPNADVAVAYASQATTNFFKIHTIQQNTEEAEKKIIQFERYWASAWSEQDSRNYIEKLLIDVQNTKE